MKKEYTKYKVCVLCLTYNHASYITDALSSFTMQDTDFPYVCCVIDDASTDGEQDIIRRFLQTNFDLDDTNLVRNEETDDYVLTFAQHRTNRNCHFAVLFLKYNHHSIKKPKLPYWLEWAENVEYLCLCEGDDYWLSPLKMQKQFDFLESNPDYGLVYTAYYEDRNGVLGDIKGKDFGIGTDGLREYLSHKGDIIALPSTMFRAEPYLRREINNHFLMGDVPIWIQLMHEYKTKFFEEATTAYRILTESMSHSGNYKKKKAFAKSAIEVRKYYAEKYGYTDIAKALYKKEKKVELLIDLYDLKLYRFICSCPWKYGISIKNVLGVFKSKYLR